MKIAAVSRQEYDDAVAALQTAKANQVSAQADVKTAQLDLGYASVRAPISGRIGRGLVTEGSLVGQGESTPMALIQQLDPVYADFRQPVNALLKLREAAAGAQAEPAVSVRVDGTGYTAKGKLLFSDVSVDPGTGQVMLRGQFSNPDGLLLPGMYVRVSASRACRATPSSCRSAPSCAAPTDRAKVLVAADGKAQERPVQTGAMQGSEWQITQGLAAGDQVIVDGAAKIPPGTPLRVQSGRRPRPPSKPRNERDRRAAPHPAPRAALSPDGFHHAEFLHQAAQLRVGDRDLHRPGGPARHFLAAGGAVPQRRAAPGHHQGDLSGRVRRGHQQHRHQPHRGRTERRQGPALLRVAEQQRRRRRNHRHLRAGHQPRPGAGGCAEPHQAGGIALPQAVVQQGLQLEQASSSFLLIYALTYKDAGKDQVGLADYAARNINNEIRRVPGVGRVQMFAAERALRIWIDPAKLVGYGLSVDEVNKAIAAQNMQVSGGSTGEQPSPSEQEITASIMVEGQLSSIPEFEAIVLRANPDGSTVRLGDVARVEMGRQDYRMSSRLNGQPAAAMGVQLAPGANALETAQGIKTRLAELSKNFPSDVSYSVPFDTSIFVKVAISKVLMTLAEAVVLVFLVMLLFLQNLRYTLIPTIVVPICLLGTLAVMLPLGFSVNMMTMFGMVLAIGILVDDAIVVVENVERIMAEEGLSPKDATIKAMGQISGAIVGITLVLAAVFLPLAFMTGSVGVIYRQFSVSLAVSILFSGFLALTLTPALSILLLKPIEKGHHEKKGFFGWFNRVFARMTDRYSATNARLLARTGRMMLLYAALVGGLGYVYTSLPSAFLPTEDQGYMNTDVQLPPGATLSRTLETTQHLEQYLGTRPAVSDVLTVQGFSFSGQGQNAGLGFVMFKDWAKRDKNESAMAEADQANQNLALVPDGTLFSVVPPSVEGMGNSSGFALRLQDRSGLGREACCRPPKP